MANDAFSDLAKQLEQFKGGTLEARERGLDKAADFMKTQFELATPTDTGKTQKSWVVQGKYKSVRYINNTRLNDKNIPVINFLEFGRKGKPFVRKTYDSNIKQAEQIFIYEVTKNE